MTTSTYSQRISHINYYVYIPRPTPTMHCNNNTNLSIASTERTMRPFSLTFATVGLFCQPAMSDS